MSGEQQLERSVLQSKERDELHAIAEALGLKPAARTSKTALVGQILRATGVDVEDNGEAKAGRASQEKTSGNGSEAQQQPGADEPADPSAGAVAEPAAEPAAEPGASSEQTPAPATDAGGEPPLTAQDPERSDPPTGQAQKQQEPSQREGSPRDQQRGDRGRDQQRQSDGGGQLEAGNRRGRRRRGRDRDRGERDLQGGPEPQFQGEPVPVAGLRAAGHAAPPSRYAARV
jgi:transcription termination factor Rho